MLLAQILEMDLCPTDQDANASREGKYHLTLDKIKLSQLCLWFLI